MSPLQKVKRLQGDTGLTWIWIFHHLAQLPCQFCQIPFGPSRIRQMVEYWNLKSTHPRSATTIVTLYGSLTQTSKHGYGGFLTGNGMLSRMVCTESLTSTIASLDCTLSAIKSFPRFCKRYSESSTVDCSFPVAQARKGNSQIIVNKTCETT